MLSKDVTFFLCNWQDFDMQDLKRVSHMLYKEYWSKDTKAKVHLPKNNFVQARDWWKCQRCFARVIIERKRKSFKAWNDKTC